MGNASSRDALWNRVTGGNFLRFQKPWVPLRTPKCRWGYARGLWKSVAAGFNKWQFILHMREAPETRLTKHLWSHRGNIAKIPFALFWILIIQSGHKLVHVTTAQLSWHVQISDLIWAYLFTKGYFTRFGLWAHKLFVKWVLWGQINPCYKSVLKCMLFTRIF